MGAKIAFTKGRNKQKRRFCRFSGLLSVSSIFPHKIGPAMLHDGSIVGPFCQLNPKSNFSMRVRWF